MSDKRAQYAYIFTIGVFIAQFIDIFFIHSDNSVFGDNIIARIVGIVMAICAAKYLKFNLFKNSFRKFSYFKDIGLGIILSIVPIFICFSLEWIYFKIRGYSYLGFSFVTPNYYYFRNPDYVALAVIIYVIVLLIGVLFKELYFRVFLISMLTRKYGVNKANIIQSVLYSLLSVPFIMYSLLSGRFEKLGVLMTIYIILAYPINNFIGGIKWGFFYRVNGSIWMSVTDHFINNFILTCVYISSERLPEKWFIFETFAVQIISCLIFLPYYFLRDKSNMMYAEETYRGREVMHPESISIKNDSDINENPAQNVNIYFDNLMKRSLRTDIVALSDIKESTDVDEIPESFNKNDFDENRKRMFETIGSHSVNDDNVNTNSELIVGLRNQKKNNEDINKPKNDNETLESVTDIKKMVNQYFEEQFDKHTF